MHTQFADISRDKALEVLAQPTPRGAVILSQSYGITSAMWLEWAITFEQLGDKGDCERALFMATNLENMERNNVI